MQPNQRPEEWQQPTTQPTNAPYAPTPTEEAPAEPQAPMAAETPNPALAPVVTMVADEPAQPSQESVSAEQPAVATPNQDVADTAEPVRWEATEYIHREKNGLWFVGFALITLALMAMAIFLMQAWTFAILIPVMAVALLVYTQRPPRTLSYTLSGKGLHINDHLYPFADFKAFGVVHGDDEYSISLIPVKRFRPAVSVYFPEEAGEAIVDLLAARLPMQELHLDFIDRLTRKLRL